MADLGRQAENDLGPTHQHAQALRIANVGNVDGDSLPNGLDVEQIRPLPRNHRVHDSHGRSARHQRQGEIAPDEAQASKNENTAMVIKVIHRGPGLPGRSE